ncbi:MAG: lysylphosphatidylglycerol synthase transmembrane domain-containing protein [Bdellovibrionota bacterium]
MKFLKSKLFQFLIGIAISAILVIWMCRVLDWTAVWESLKNAAYLPLIPALLIIWLHFVLRAFRWKLLLPLDANISIRDLFDAIMLGNFANFVLPLRAGEIIRPGMVSRISKVSFSACFVSVVIERFFDLSTVLIFFSILLQFIPSVPAWVHQGAYTLGFLSIVLFVFIIASAFMPELLAKLIYFFTDKLPAKIKEPVMEISD